MFCRGSAYKISGARKHKTTNFELKLIEGRDTAITMRPTSLKQINGMRYIVKHDLGEEVEF